MHKHTRPEKPTNGNVQASLHALLAQVDQTDADLRQQSYEEQLAHLPPTPNADSCALFLHCYQLESELLDYHKGSVAEQQRIYRAIEELLMQYRSSVNSEVVWECLHQVQISLIKARRREKNVASFIQQIKDELAIIWFNDPEFKKLMEEAQEPCSSKLIQCLLDLFYEYFCFTFELLEKASAEQSKELNVFKMQLFSSFSKACSYIRDKHSKLDLLGLKCLMLMLLLSRENDAVVQECPITFENISQYLNPNEVQNNAQRDNVQRIIRGYQLAEEVRRTDLIERLSNSILVQQAFSAEDRDRLAIDPSLGLLARGRAAMLALEINNAYLARDLMQQCKILTTQGNNGGLAIQHILFLKPRIGHDYCLIHSVFNMGAIHYATLFKYVNDNHDALIRGYAGAELPQTKTLMFAWLDYVRMMEPLFLAKKIPHSQWSNSIEKLQRVRDAYITKRNLSNDGSASSPMENGKIHLWRDWIILLSVWRLSYDYLKTNSNGDLFKTKLEEVLSSFNLLFDQLSTHSDFLSFLRFFTLEDEYFKIRIESWLRQYESEQAWENHATALRTMLAAPHLAVRCKFIDPIFESLFQYRSKPKLKELMRVVSVQIDQDVSVIEREPDQLSKLDRDIYYETSMYWRIRFYDFIEERSNSIMQMSILYLALPLGHRSDGVLRKRRIGNIRLSFAQEVIPEHLTHGDDSCALLNYLLEHAIQFWLLNIPTAELPALLKTAAPIEQEILSEGLNVLQLMIDFIVKEISKFANNKWERAPNLQVFLTRLRQLMTIMSSCYTSGQEIEFPNTDALDFFLGGVIFLRAFSPFLTSEEKIELDKIFIGLNMKLGLLVTNRKEFRFRNGESISPQKDLSFVQRHVIFHSLLDRLKQISPRQQQLSTQVDVVCADDLAQLITKLIQAIEPERQWKLLNRFVPLINTCAVMQFTALSSQIDNKLLARFFSRSNMLWLCMHNKQALFFIMALVSYRAHRSADEEFIAGLSEQVSKLEIDLNEPHSYLIQWLDLYQLSFPEPLPVWLSHLIEILKLLRNKDILEIGRYVERLGKFDFPDRQKESGSYWLACVLYAELLMNWQLPNEDNLRIYMRLCHKNLRNHYKLKIPQEASEIIEELAGKKILSVFPEEQNNDSKRKKKDKEKATKAAHEANGKVNSCVTQVVQLPNGHTSVAAEPPTPKAKDDAKEHDMNKKESDSSKAKPIAKAAASSSAVASSVLSAAVTPSKPSVPPTHKTQAQSRAAGQSLPVSNGRGDNHLKPPSSTHKPMESTTQQRSQWQPNVFKPAAEIRAPIPVRTVALPAVDDQLQFPPLPLATRTVMSEEGNQKIEHVTKPSTLDEHTNGLVAGTTDVAGVVAAVNPVSVIQNNSAIMKAVKSGVSVQAEQYPSVTELTQQLAERDKKISTQIAEIDVLRLQYAELKAQFEAEQKRKLESEELMRAELVKKEEENRGILSHLLALQQALVAANAKILSLERASSQHASSEGSLQSILQERDWLNCLISFYRTRLESFGGAVTKDHFTHLHGLFQQGKTDAMNAFARGTYVPPSSNHASPTFGPSMNGK